MAPLRYAHRATVTLLVVALGLPACKGSATDDARRRAEPSTAKVPATSAAPSASAGGTTTPASTLSRSKIQTVFVILMENKAWSEVKGSPDGPYVNRTLLPRASIADGYRGGREGTLHPSEPNYVWLEAGDNLGITDNEEPATNHRETRDHLVTQLEAAGISWKTYQEDIDGDVCPLTWIRNYQPKHNPFVFFDDVTDRNDPKSRRCIEHVRPLTELEPDLRAGKTARYVFITPNQCNDMHSSCDPLRNPVKQGDDWLKRYAALILDSPAYSDRGLLIITWDEAEPHYPDCTMADCPVGLLAFSPLAKGGGYTNRIRYDHSSLLRSLQVIFDTRPFLRGAHRATDLSDLFMDP